MNNFILITLVIFFITFFFDYSLKKMERKSDFKKLYLNRFYYLFFYILMFLVFGYIKAKSNLNDNIFNFLFGIYFLFFLYISIKRILILNIKDFFKKILIFFLFLPVIFFILLFSLLFLKINFSNFININVLSFIWLFNLISVILIFFLNVNKNKIKKENKKNIFNKGTKLYLIFIIISLIILQLTGHLIKIRNDYSKRIYKINILNLKTNKKLSNIIEKGFNNDGSYEFNLYRFNKEYFVNNDIIYSINKEKQKKLLNNLNGEIFKIEHPINNIFEGNLDYIIFNFQKCYIDKEKNFCFLKARKVKKQYYINNNGIQIFLFYLILGLLIFKRDLLKKVFGNKIFYYIFLPFRVLYLLIKKYIFKFFPKFIKFTKKSFKKLEEIEKDLKNKK